MTKLEKEAEDWLDIKYLPDMGVRHPCKVAYIAGAEAHLSQWHDLRKDPSDLPKDTAVLYLVRVYSWDFGFSHLYKKYGTYIPVVCEWTGEYFKALDRMAYSNARNIKSCCAWKEIVLPELNRLQDVTDET